MKKIFLAATAFVFSLATFAQTTPAAQPKAEDLIKVNVEKHDFGKILQGTPVTYSFEIKNVSEKPLVVENTWASCGCTTPEKIVDPILPGKTVSLKVQYNAAAAAPFSKDVFIKLAGIDQPKTVQISGEVLTAEAYDAYMKDKKPGTEMPAANNTRVPTTSPSSPSISTNSSQPKLSKNQ
ncbi:MAG: DUF1573 domain-containing protein [Chitinophagaceae bacterium]|nr:DUF1573 domain-containing protein [Chitinophagaceae bacterium]MBK9569312.1 DUF1573 domain-containing protein [Chitinophagaceae bacterium]MBL0273756.1 DUF1573 domain-containing protein [Chitinophagaceae bacterium]